MLSRFAYKLHRELVDSGWVTPEIEYPSYRALWRALGSRPVVEAVDGVLAVDEQEDADRRAGGSHGNKGEEAALVAIEMAELMGRLP